MVTYPIAQGGQLLLLETISDVEMASKPVDVDFIRPADVTAGDIALPLL